MNLAQTIELFCTGTSEGANKAWDERGRKGIEVNIDPAAKKMLKQYNVSKNDVVRGFTFNNPDYHVKYLGINSSTEFGGYLIVYGNVADSSGRQMGWFKNSILGKKVQHNEFQLDESAQGKGVATSLFKNELALYRKMGLKEIGLRAIQVGKYTWATHGFDFDSKETLDSAKSAFASFVKNKHGVSLSAGDIAGLKHSWDIARFSIGGKKVGKEFMLKKMKDWNGEMSL